MSGVKGREWACPFLEPYHLVSEQQHGLQAEFAGAEIEEILQARPQELHHHYVVVALRPAPLDGGDAHCMDRKKGKREGEREKRGREGER